MNRCGAKFFDPVRDLLGMWFSRFPVEHRPGLLGNLTDGNDHNFESAFWEMYLYQLVTANGARVVIHPDVRGTPHHPDFLVHDVVPYYLEAVAVGVNNETVKRDSRLAVVEAVIDQARTSGISLSFNWYIIGPAPIKAKKLRNELLRFVSTLDAVVLEADFRSGGFRCQQPYQFDEDGWELEFTPFPTGGADTSLVSIRGAGRAGGVDNESGLRRVLDTKANRYGTDLDHPLVTAVLSNTEVPTKLFEIRNVLYGEQHVSPLNVVRHKDLFDDGHWRTRRRGWRRSHNPHVVTSCGLDFYKLATVAPRFWSTIQPDAYRLPGLPWADPVDVAGPEPSPATMAPNIRTLGVTEDWCLGDPDYGPR